MCVGCNAPLRKERERGFLSGLCEVKCQSATITIRNWVLKVGAVVDDDSSGSAVHSTSTAGGPSESPTFGASADWRSFAFDLQTLPILAN